MKPFLNPFSTPVFRKGSVLPFLLLAIFLLAPMACFASDARAAEEAKAYVLMQTSKGDLLIELWPEKAPETVANFVQYAEDGFFDGTVFHRVIPGFVIQGGGFEPGLKRKPTRKPIQNEALPEVKNLRGTLSMARTSDPDSATSQFFINLKDNPSLDRRSKSPSGYGYCVFGKVVEGMDVVDAIAGVRTGNRGPYRDVPVEPVLINKAKKSEARP